MQALRTLARAAPLARSFSTSAPRSLAKMQLIGRLADAPEIQATSTGRDIVRYALGVSYGSKDESGNRPVSWFRVASFIDEGPQRDLLTNLPKGSLLFVEADARMDTFEVDGQKRTALNLRQLQFEVLSRPRPVESEVDPAEAPSSGVGAS